MSKDERLDLFEIFWKAYPRKVGKLACLKIWQRRKYDRETVDKMLETLKWQVKLKQWQDKSLIPHPSTWLNQGRWEDEMDTDLLVTSVQPTSKDQMKELQRIMKAKSDKMRSEKGNGVVKLHEIN
jgi:hypothetical protein